MMNKLLNRFGKTFWLSVLIVFFCAPVISHAQESYTKGQPIFPAFEGWRENPDGTINFIFGYMNDNWTEAPFIPIGENNYFSPDEPDRGQPTKFFPRRNRFVFQVTVPADFGDSELVWHLSHNGQDYSAHATLNPNYVIDNLAIASETGSLGIGTSSPESRSNQPPDIELQGDDVRTVRVGEPLVISSHVADDGIPRVSPAAPMDEQSLNRRMLVPSPKPAVGKVNGLHVTWHLYRGPADIMVEPPQTKVWEDTRVGANSPWAVFWRPPEIPEDGIIEVTARFQEPGTYILWGRADDGGLYDDTYVTVNVSP